MLTREFEKPLVSVSITTYNHAGYISACLDSILSQQTTFPFEIILGEDESTDGTRDICIAYAEKFPGRIKLFLRSRKDVIYINGGPTGRFNMIENLKAAKGDFIALCEGDDYWTDPLKLQKQVDFMQVNPDCAICFHSAFIHYEDGSKPDEISNPQQKKWSTIEDLAKGNFINTATCLFRNTLRGNFPKWYYSIAVGDWPLHLLNAQHGRIGFIDEPMAVYRIHSGSIWGNQKKLQMHLRILGMLEVLRGEMPRQYRNIFAVSMAAQAINIAAIYEKEGQRWLAFQYFWRTWKWSEPGKFSIADLLSKFKRTLIS